jgi:hypothetical protein
MSFYSYVYVFLFSNDGVIQREKDVIGMPDNQGKNTGTHQ